MDVIEFTDSLRQRMDARVMSAADDIRSGIAPVSGGIASTITNMEFQTHSRGLILAMADALVELGLVEPAL
jgi:hypothetical protein